MRVPQAFLRLAEEVRTDPEPPWRCGCLVPQRQISPSAFATRPEIVGVDLRASPPIPITSGLEEFEEGHPGPASGIHALNIMRRAERRAILAGNSAPSA